MSTSLEFDCNSSRDRGVESGRVMKPLKLLCVMVTKFDCELAQ